MSKFDMPNDIPKRDPKSDEIIKKMDEKAKGSLEDRKRRVELAKLISLDKELFDIDEFGKFYSLKGDDGEVFVTPGMIFEFEEEYYLKNPEIKTLEEYARYRKNLDAQAGG